MRRRPRYLDASTSRRTGGTISAGSGSARPDAVRSPPMPTPTPPRRARGRAAQHREEPAGEARRHHQRHAAGAAGRRGARAPRDLARPSQGPGERLPRPLHGAVARRSSRRRRPCTPSAVGEPGVISTTLRGLIEGRTITSSQAAKVAQLIADRRTLLIFGDRATGKSTLLNALFELVSLDERFVAVERGPDLPALKERSFCLRLTIERRHRPAGAVRQGAPHAAGTARDRRDPLAPRSRCSSTCWRRTRASAASPRCAPTGEQGARDDRRRAAARVPTRGRAAASCRRDAAGLSAHALRREGRAPPRRPLGGHRASPRTVSSCWARWRDGRRSSSTSWSPRPDRAGADRTPAPGARHGPPRRHASRVTRRPAGQRHTPTSPPAASSLSVPTAGALWLSAPSRSGIMPGRRLLAAFAALAACHPCSSSRGWGR